MPFRDHSKDKGIPVASLRDVLRFARPLVETGVVLGVYIETKQPTWHEDIGLPLEQPLLDALDAEGWFQLPAGAIVLQSFEPQACFCPAKHPWLLCLIEVLLAQDSGHVRSHRAGTQRDVPWAFTPRILLLIAGPIVLFRNVTVCASPICAPFLHHESAHREL